MTLTITWNNFTRLFAYYYPQFKGRGLLGAASPFYKKVKGCTSVSFDEHNIYADGKAFPVVAYERKRDPTGYNLWVTSCRGRVPDMAQACRDWSALPQDTRDRYNRIAKSGDDWKLFYEMLRYTKDLTPLGHLRQFESSTSSFLAWLARNAAARA